MEAPLSRSEARVATATPRRTLGQLCKHFGHKIPASFDAERRRFEFPFGTCLLTAEEARVKLESVVARHQDALRSGKSW